MREMESDLARYYARERMNGHDDGPMPDPFSIGALEGMLCVQWTKRNRARARTYK